VVLLISVGAIAWETVGRLSSPNAVEGKTVIRMAAAGILINEAMALTFMRGRKNDLNIRGVFIHMAPDTFIPTATYALSVHSGLVRDACHGKLSIPRPSDGRCPER
jgi:Co/Zn/Cd efflux system component